MSTDRRRKLPQVTDFAPEEVTPAVLILLEICHEQQAQIQALRDEIARLKGGNPRPPIKPSRLDSEPDNSARSTPGQCPRQAQTPQDASARDS